MTELGGVTQDQDPIFLQQLQNNKNASMNQLEHKDTQVIRVNEG